MKKFKRIFLPFLFLFHIASAQRSYDPMVKIVIGPDHTDWVYTRGEKAQFLVTVMEFGNPLKNVPVHYEVGPERKKPFKEDSMVLSKGVLTIDGGTMKVPGFLRCRVVATVDGKQYEGVATVGFDPLSIEPVIENPTDFVEFWNHAKDELSKIPLDAHITLMPSRCTEKVKEGKYPGLLNVPGAGVYPNDGNIEMAEAGLITLEIGIHGIPLDMDPKVYDNLGWGALRG